MLERDVEGGSFESGVANCGFDGFLQPFFVAACDVHFGSVALEGLGDDEAETRATFSQHDQHMRFEVA